MPLPQGASDNLNPIRGGQVQCRIAIRQCLGALLIPRTMEPVPASDGVPQSADSVAARRHPIKSTSPSMAARLTGVLEQPEADAETSLVEHADRRLYPSVRIQSTCSSA